MPKSLVTKLAILFVTTAETKVLINPHTHSGVKQVGFDYQGTWTTKPSVQKVRVKFFGCIPLSVECKQNDMFVRRVSDKSLSSKLPTKISNLLWEIQIFSRQFDG